MRTSNSRSSRLSVQADYYRYNLINQENYCSDLHMLPKELKSGSSGMTTNQMDIHSVHNKEIKCTELGVTAFEPEKHTAHDEFPITSESISARTVNEIIDNQIFFYPVITDPSDLNVQKHDEDKVALSVTNTMPELKWHASIPFIQNPPPFNLGNDAAEICAHLLFKLETNRPQGSNETVYRNYQIVLRRVRRNSNLCRFLLRVDPLKWYRFNKGRKNIAEQAKDFIDQVEYEHEEDKFFSSSELRENRYKNLKNLWVCDNGDEHSCGFYVKEQTCIYQNDQIYAVTRSDGSPVITICPIKHCTNDDWVRTPAAWKAVLTVLEYIQKELKLDELPFYEIYANFGHWHSQIANGCLSGHAHINIVLTSAAIKAYEKSCGELSRLVCSTIGPRDYRQDDASALRAELKKN